MRLGLSHASCVFGVAVTAVLFMAGTPADAAVTGTYNSANNSAYGASATVSVATPNLTLGIPGVLEVIANEQIHNPDGSLTVNALDITLLGGGVTGAVGSGHIVLASSTCAPVDPSADPAGPTATKTVPTQASGPTSKAATTPVPGDNSGVISQISVVPVGAPQTGDGSLATAIVR